MGDKTTESEINKSIHLQEFRYSGVSLTDAGEITVLILGIGKIRKGKWKSWVKSIISNWRIPSNEFISFIKGPIPNYFVGKTGPETDIRYKFVFDKNAHSPDLQIFQTERQIFGVICVVDCETNPKISNVYKEYINILSQFPSVICSKCLGFDYAGQIDGSQISSISLFSNSEEDLSGSVRIQLRNFSGIMISSLSMMADSIEKSSSTNYDKTIDDLDREQIGLFRNANNVVLKMMKQIYKISKNERVTLERQSTENQYFFLKNPYSGTSHTGDFEPTSDIKIRKKSSIDSIGLYDEKNDQNKLIQGRIKKLEGDLLFMSGRITEAIAAYRLCIEFAVASDDYLWQGCALESYASSLFILLDRKTERSFIIALAICPPDTNIELTYAKNDPLGVMDQMFIEEASIGGISPTARNYDPANAFSSSDGIFSLIKEIAKLFSMAISCYEKNYLFPPLLHSEACLKRAILQLLLDQHTTPEVLDARIHKILSRQPYQNVSDFNYDNNAPRINRKIWRNTALEMAAWIHRGWTQAVMSLDLKDLMKLSATITLLFHSSGYVRKEAFFLRQFLLLIQPLLYSNPDTPETTPALSKVETGVDLRTQKHIIECLGSVVNLYNVENPLYFLKDTTVFHQWSLWLNNINEIRNTLKMEKSGILWIGWYHLQTDVLKECISIAETVPSYQHAIAATFRLLRCLSYIQSLAENILDTEILGFGFGIKQIKSEQTNLLKYLERVLHLYHNRYHLQSIAKPLAEKESKLKTLPALAAGIEDQVTRKLDIFRFIPRVVGSDAIVVGDVFNNLLENIQPHFLNSLISGHCNTQLTSKDKLNSKSLFLHNPGNKKSSGNKKLKSESFSILVSGENSYFSATFKNPFSFPLFLNNVQLLVEFRHKDSKGFKQHQSLQPEEYGDDLNLGNGYDVDQQILERSNSVVTSILSSFTIPSSSYYTATLTVIPKKPGFAQVLGVRCTVFEKITINCLLPEISSEDQKRNLRFLRVRKRLISEFPPEIIENANDSSMLMALTNPIAGFTLPITILTPQPKLEVSVLGLETQMYPLSLMQLNEGEVVPFYMILQNLGTIPITYYKVKFNELDPNNALDNFANTNRLYNSSALSSFGTKANINESVDTYNKSRPKTTTLKDIGAFSLSSVFRQVSKSNNISTIYPGQYLRLDYTVFGHPGCNGTTFKLTYGYTDENENNQIKDSSLENISEPKNSVVTHTKEINKNLSIQVSKILVPTLKHSLCSILPLPLGLNLFDSEEDIYSHENISVYQLLKRLVKSVNNWQKDIANKSKTQNLTKSLDSEKKSRLLELQQFLAAYYCIASFNVSNLSTSSVDARFELKLYLPNVGELSQNQLRAEYTKPRSFKFILQTIKVIIPGNSTNFKVMLPINRIRFNEFALFRSGKTIFSESGTLRYDKYIWNKSLQQIYVSSKRVPFAQNQSKNLQPEGLRFDGDGYESYDEILEENFEDIDSNAQLDHFGDDSSGSRSPTPQYIVPQGPKLSKAEILSNKRFSFYQYVLLESIRIRYNLLDYNRRGYINPIPFVKLDHRDIPRLTLDSLEIKTFVALNKNHVASSFDIKDIVQPLNPEHDNPQNLSIGVSSSMDLDRPTSPTLYQFYQKPGTGFLNNSFYSLCNPMSYAILCINLRNMNPEKQLDLAITIQLLATNKNNQDQTAAINPFAKQKYTLSGNNRHSISRPNFDNELLSAYSGDYEGVDDLNIYDSSNLNFSSDNAYYATHKTKAAYQILSIATADVPTFFKPTKITDQKDNRIGSAALSTNTQPTEALAFAQKANISLKKDLKSGVSPKTTLVASKIDRFGAKEFIYNRKAPINTSKEATTAGYNNRTISTEMGFTKSANTVLTSNISEAGTLKQTSKLAISLSKNNNLKLETTNGGESANAKNEPPPGVLKMTNTNSVPDICWKPITNYMLPSLKGNRDMLIKVPVFVCSSGRYLFEYKISPVQPSFKHGVTNEHSNVINRNIKSIIYPDLVGKSAEINDAFLGIDSDFVSGPHSITKGTFTLYAI